MKTFYIVLLVFVFSHCFGQGNYLTNTTPNGTTSIGSSPENFIEFNGYVYFTAESDATLGELWRTDGTTVGTKLFADIGITTYPGEENYFTIYNQELYFVANNSKDGDQIWKTNGTLEGTYPVTDFSYTIPYLSQYGRIKRLTVFMDKLFFIHSSDEYGWELFTTEGSISTTSLFYDINPGINNSMSDVSPIVIDSNMYFLANNGVNGTELWKTDGTLSGTNLVFDLIAGSAYTLIQNLTEFDHNLYFTADDGINGKELWKSDGTTFGTFMLSDVYLGSESSSPNNLTVSGSFLYFSAKYDNGNRELFKTDGTSLGTVIVLNINPSATDNGLGPKNLYNANGTLYFTHNNSTLGYELYKSDGSASGTYMIKDIRVGASSSDPANFFYFNGSVYFSANDNVAGVEVWRTDGTNLGTALFANINGGFASSLPASFCAFGPKIVFYAYTNQGYEPYVTDETSTGTFRLRNIFLFNTSGTIDSKNSEIFEDKLFFGMGALYTTDGTLINTSLFSSTSSSPRDFHVVANKMYFYKDDGLYRTDGTPSGTSKIHSFTSFINHTALYGSIGTKYLYFVNDPSGSLTRLFSCDTNTAPTLVTTISNSSMGPSDKNECILMNNALYFTTDNTGVGKEIWRTNGTVSGTYLLKNINPGSAGSDPKNLTVLGNNLYFTATEPINGTEIWKSDGTNAGTVLLKDINPGISSSFPESFEVFDDTLFFSANNGVDGKELWSTNGSSIGTEMYTNINIGELSSKPLNLTKSINGLYFSAKTEDEGRELWIKKNNEQPVLVVNIGPEKFSSNPSNLTVINNLVYFTANDGIHGYEPYYSLGSTCSTQMIEDFNPGDKGSLPCFLGEANQKILFYGHTDLYGSELYSINATQQHTDTAVACENYFWANINDTLETSGYFSVVIPNIFGCDSIVNLNLTVGTPTNSVQDITACSSYTWIDGNTYYSSNTTAIQTLTSITGCDSLIQLNLQINNTSSTFDTIVACDSYNWSANNSIIDSTGDYTLTLASVNGCDSLVFLNSTIHQSSQSVFTEITCTDFTWIDGNTYNSSTNTPFYTLNNIYGCDSVIYLDLTIQSNQIVDTVITCTPYTWIDGNTYYTSTNTPTYQLTNINGCDSITTLNLTILSNDIIDYHSSCGPYTWIDGNTYSTTTTSPSITFTNVYGCDSIVSLNLEVNNFNAELIHDGSGILVSTTGTPINWLDCDNNFIIPGQFFNFYQPPPSGSYAVISTDGTCVDTSDCFLMDNIGINGNQLNGLKMYPNPTNSNIHFKFESFKESRLEIKTALGSSVINKEVKSEESISVIDLAPGLYFYEIHVDSVLYRGKFEKMTTQ
jgi:ELWxxDGT repeat protein